MFRHAFGNAWEAVILPETAHSYAAPPWLQDAVLALQFKYSADRFVLVRSIAALLSPFPMYGFAIGCFDCPGPCYGLGPGDTVDNFEDHLNCPWHRKRVEKRVSLYRSKL